MINADSKFYDLAPENNEITKQDFLEFDASKLQYKNIHVVGNPPFGRQSSLAIKFIKKCCEFAKTISFILPKSFKKESLKRNFAVNFHLVNTLELPKNSFLVNNSEYDVPCVFQIWRKETAARIIQDKQAPRNFKFVEKNDSPDISFRRVGANAGTISKNIEDCSVQSHYFIKFLAGGIDENIAKLSVAKFDTNNTVGPKSISKQELIIAFNKELIIN